MRIQLHGSMITTLALALSIVVLAGCFPPTNLPTGSPGTPGGSTPGVPGEPTGVPSPSPSGVEGDWQLVSVGGVPAVPGSEATMRLEGGTANGTTGCNGYNAPYELSGSDGIKFGLMTSTLMACEDPIMAQERAFGAALAAATRYGLTQDALTLQDASGAGLASFRPRAHASLTRTTWLATGINNGRQAVSSVVSGTEVTAVFGTDGNLTGKAGCNQYSSRYTMDGNNLTIEPPVTTEMFCNAAGVMAQEQGYLMALTQVTAYSIDGDRLELRSTDGALQVKYTAQQ